MRRAEGWGKVAKSSSFAKGCEFEGRSNSRAVEKERKKEMRDANERQS